MKDLLTPIGRYAVVTLHETDVFGNGWITRVMLDGLAIAGDGESR
jgi:hypothetical protein